MYKTERAYGRTAEQALDALEEKLSQKKVKAYIGGPSVIRSEYPDAGKRKYFAFQAFKA